MIAEHEAINLIEGLEQAARRSRPLLMFGLIAIVIGFAIVIYFLETQRSQLQTQNREMEKRAIQAERLVAKLRAAEAEGEASPALSEVLSEAERLSSSYTEAPETPAEAAAQKPLETMRVDIFYCESLGAPGKARAERIAALRPASATEPWRARPLSAERNKVDPYKVRQNEIRYNGDEAKAAATLRQMMARPLGQPPVNRFNEAPSWNYLSVFLCEGAGDVPAPAAR